MAREMAQSTLSGGIVGFDENVNLLNTNCPNLYYNTIFNIKRACDSII